MTFRSELDDRPPPPPRTGPAPATRIRAGLVARLAAVALVCSAPIAAWRVTGPNPGNEYRNDPLRDPGEWDYLLRPPTWDPGLERVIGWGGVVVFVLAVVVWTAGWWRGRLDPVWTLPLVLVTLVGLGVGVGQRVVTSAVIGANIGGGFVLFFGGPTAVFLVAAAATRTAVVLRTTEVVYRR